MVQYISQPLSRHNLRNYAFQLRKLLNVENQLYFPVMEFLEVLPNIFSQLSWEIVEDTEFSQYVHGETDILNHYIKIRQSVYDGACEGNGRDRMTVMHEIAHYLLLCVNGVKLQRNFDKQVVKAYCDPEWQAKCLAGEIMIPAHLVAGMDLFDVIEKCGVSWDAAAYQMRHIS